MSNQKMTKRCYVGDDLQMSYQKTSYRCLRRGVLYMS